MYIILSRDKTNFGATVETLQEEVLEEYLQSVNAKKDAMLSFGEGTDVYVSEDRIYSVRKYNGGELSQLNFRRCESTSQNNLSDSDKLAILSKLIGL